MNTATAIITNGGKLIYPFDLKPADVDIRIIAHALSNICRFGGHLPRFYSVAQHSVHVAERVDQLQSNPTLTLRALLHDASEAYIGDIVRPLKRSGLFEAYGQVEDRIMLVIYERFGLEGPAELDAWTASADRDLGTLEAMILGGWDVMTWADCPRPSFDRVLVSLPPTAAKQLFLNYFAETMQRITLEQYTPAERAD